MPVYLDVDISQLQATIDRMRAVHTKREFELLMYRSFRRTGQHVRTIMKKDLPREYKAKATWIGQNVKNPKTQFGGFGGSAVSCSIPINGTRGVLGSQFKASGPRGRKSKTVKAYKITAQILKNKKTILPSTMPSDPYGGNPPFLVRAGGKIPVGLVFTRKTKARLPVMRVVGIGVPQMPLNRAQDDVQDDIMQTLEQRIEHEHSYMINRCR